MGSHLALRRRRRVGDVATHTYERPHASTTQAPWHRSTTRKGKSVWRARGPLRTHLVLFARNAQARNRLEPRKRRRVRNLVAPIPDAMYRHRLKLTRPEPSLLGFGQFRCRVGRLRLGVGQTWLGLHNCTIFRLARLVCGPKKRKSEFNSRRSSCGDIAFTWSAGAKRNRNKHEQSKTRHSVSQALDRRRRHGATKRSMLCRFQASSTLAFRRFKSSNAESTDFDGRDPTAGIRRPPPSSAAGDAPPSSAEFSGTRSARAATNVGQV